MIIGIVGKMRSGKETVGQIITNELTKKRFSVTTHRFSDILRETEKSWHLPQGRDTQQKLVLAMRHYFGEEVLSNVLEKRVLNTNADFIILDGLRWINDDYPLLRRLPNNYLIYIDAPDELRWSRAIVNNPEKPDETKYNFEEFVIRDNAQNEIEIPMFREHADFIIDNSKDVEFLRDQIQKFLSTLLT